MKKSLWLFHFGGASCNNCDIEILACLNPRFDVERFGMLLVGSPRHADVLLVNGSINKKGKERLLEVYRQTAKPCLVVAIGACGCTGGIFAGSDTFAGPVDNIIPVDAYIPGCPPKPEALLAGLAKLVDAKFGKKKIGSPDHAPKIEPDESVTNKVTETELVENGIEENGTVTNKKQSS